MTESFFKSEPEKKPSGEIPDLEDTSGNTEAADRPEGESFRSEESRMAAIMAYIPLLCFIPLLNMKENREAHFHARQGVLLFLIELVAVIFLIDGISRFVFKAVLIVAIALSVVGIYFAVQGKSYKLPVIGDWADKAKM
ncbi:MAG: hypothetical protein JSW34_02960 [Candidatus Zixiibacteriota bacterium]|nr:MAG: hypothetical protein JSW34_02960 [candidate division Zixibacteria bacterium]